MRVRVEVSVAAASMWFVIAAANLRTGPLNLEGQRRAAARCAEACAGGAGQAEASGAAGTCSWSSSGPSCSILRRSHGCAGAEAFQRSSPPHAVRAIIRQPHHQVSLLEPFSP